LVAVEVASRATLPSPAASKTLVAPNSSFRWTDEEAFIEGEDAIFPDLRNGLELDEASLQVAGMGILGAESNFILAS
jgi:hypothetical protein